MKKTRTHTRPNQTWSKHTRRYTHDQTRHDQHTHTLYNLPDMTWESASCNPRSKLSQKCVKIPLSLEGWNAHDAHEMLGWRHFERGGARNGARALAQAMYDSMYHQPGIGGPDNLSRLHLRAQSQIDHTRTVRLRIVRITAQGRASMARTLHHFIHTHTQSSYPHIFNLRSR